MKGYSLAMFKHDLRRVPAHRTKNPALTIDTAHVLGPDFLESALENYGDLDTEALLRRLPAELLLEKFTFDQVCKIRYSQFIMMDSSVENLFKTDPEFAIVQKIDNSMWRWGCGRDVWNEVVDVYNGIRRFAIPADGFDVRLDFTDGYRERGHAIESGTYLDGVFGFLVYYRGDHVMTLGFSVMKGRRILVQQVQLAKRKGNRFLFNLPANRVEFFLQCFAAAFPRHSLCIADGGDICQVNLRSYQEGLNRVVRLMGDNPKPRYLQEKEAFETSIAHLTADLPRLASLYANTGQFSQVESFEVNGIRHYRLAARGPAAECRIASSLNRTLPEISRCAM